MTSKWLSPPVALSVGYFYVLILIVVFYLFGFYDNNSYFQWGPPLLFFNHTIESSQTFYIFMLVLLIHQLIYNWCIEVVYPFIINNIQQTESTTIPYPKGMCVLLVNANALYNQIHFAIIVGGITSQISFLCLFICADFITLSYINYQYVRKRLYISPEEQLKVEKGEEKGEIEEKGEVTGEHPVELHRQPQLELVGAEPY